MKSMMRGLLTTACVLTNSLSLLTGVASIYSFRPWITVLKGWTLGGYDGDMLLSMAVGVAFAVFKNVLAVHWAKESLAGRRAWLAIFLWLICLAYACASVVGYGVGPIVRPDAPLRVVVLMIGLWLVNEILAGLLPAIVWQDKVAIEPVTTLHQPVKLREEYETTPPLPAIVYQPHSRDLLAILCRLVTGPAEHGVQVTAHGCIVTAQRRLAALAGIAAGQVNKELHKLQREGAITLTTSGRRTVIRLRS